MKFASKKTYLFLSLLLLVCIAGAILFVFSRFVPLRAGEGAGGSESAETARTTHAADDSPHPTMTVKTTTVTRRNVAMYNTYPGTVRARQTAKLSFRVGGPLVEVHVDSGSRVKKGDLLMKIDPRDFSDQVKATENSLKALRAKLSAMQKGARDEDLHALEAAVDAAEATLKYVELEYERMEELVQENAISQSQFDSIVSERQAAQSALRAAKEELKKGEEGARPEDIEAMQAEIGALEAKLSLAKSSLQDIELRAPFDGLVTRRYVENHEFVPPSKPVLSMHDISQLEIDVHLPESELVRRDLSESFPVKVQFFSTGDEVFEAKKTEIDTDADPETQTYLVTFSMPAPQKTNILPGMSAEVIVPSLKEEARSALVVPAGSVISDYTKRDFVWVVSPESTRVEKRMILKGRLTDEDEYIVHRGLKEGEQVVVEGAQRIVAGMPIEIESKD